MTTEQAYRPKDQWADPVFEYERIECADCGAPLQEAPSWAEQPDQQVYRCPWSARSRMRVEHEEPGLLVYNCGWEKGTVARRIGESVR